MSTLTAKSPPHTATESVRRKPPATAPMSTSSGPDLEALPQQIDPFPPATRPVPQHYTPAGADMTPLGAQRDPAFDPAAEGALDPSAGTALGPAGQRSSDATPHTDGVAAPHRTAAATKNANAPVAERAFDPAAFNSPKLDRPMYNRSPLEIPNDLASPAMFAGAIVGQAIEILVGLRPARQLQTWLHPEVYQALVRRAGLTQRIKGRPDKIAAPRVKRSRTFSPRQGVQEVALVVFDGIKTRAAAVRLEVRRNRWHVTALDII